VADQQDGILARVLFQHLLKVRKTRLRTQRIVGHQFAFVAHFISDQSGGLGGTFQRAGNDGLHLHAERGQSAANISALLDAIIIKSALLVLLRAGQLLPGAGVT
jgi:hypothetical protein